jgi:hypothetical protein
LNKTLIQDVAQTDSRSFALTSWTIPRYSAMIGRVAEPGPEVGPMVFSSRFPKTAKARGRKGQFVPGNDFPPKAA